jgi:3',5'-cyclic-AMP phosphodiesterase
MIHFKYTGYAILSLHVFLGCNSWEFSPNQTFDGDSPRNLNKLSMERLATNAQDDTITICFVGDSQRFYDEIEKFVRKANSIEEIDFILLSGDIADFGLLQEFEWVYERLSKLNKPFFGIVGNHDVVANGEAVFQRMFGPLNESFIYDSVKFIMHNTNSREYTTGNVPDLLWLENELKQHEGVRYYVAVSHVPPFGGGDFDPSLEIPYAALFRETPGFLMSLHGHAHRHVDYSHFNDGVRYITSYAFDDRSFVILKIVNGTVFKTLVDY